MSVSQRRVCPQLNTKTEQRETAEVLGAISLCTVDNVWTAFCERTPLWFSVFQTCTEFWILS